MNALTRHYQPIVCAMIDAAADERRLIRVLNEAHPHRLIVWKLMKAVAIKPNAKKCHGKELEFQTYLAFCQLRSRVAGILSRHGLELHRSGGTDMDEMWIEPAHAGSPSN